MRVRLSKIAARARQRAGATVVDGFFRGASALGKLHPRARPERHGVAVERDLAYLPTGRREHLLDVYRPLGEDGPRPAVLYVHGGGFRILSKDTHWVMGLAFARRGYVVFNVSYRLAPEHPFPAAIEDVCAAYRWVVANAARYGADPARLVLAGESAGANLVTALTVALAYPRPEPWARAAYDEGVLPRAVLPACGLFEVGRPERFRDRFPSLSPFVHDRLVEVSRAYLRGAERLPAEAIDLASPLLVFERGERPTRALPPFFLPCGTRDPLVDDTARLAKALDALGVEHDTRYYPGEPHAFHAFVMREAARSQWRHAYAFLDRALARGAAGPEAGA
ncbi:MAG: alpha/beta hydrolase [Polyangiaceae bacterium]|nr:alpha/beta hydrolase [Polyangiaceae bacterium]